MKLKRTTHGLPGGKGRRPGIRATALQQLLLTALLLLPNCIIKSAIADAGDEYSMIINITGTITSNGACTFNQGGALQVDFGKVRLKPTGASTLQLDGSYEQPIASSFTCSGDSAGLLQMKFISSSGSYADYNGTSVLATDKGLVAIQLMVNGTAKTMNQWFTVSPDSPPGLRAKLVQVSTQNTQNVVSGDIFTASGSLVMAFN